MFDVVIAGAGPAGLVLALVLQRLGLKIRVIDKAPAPGTASRAVAVHARTLEFYAMLDLADEITQAGYKMNAVNYWVKGSRRARAYFGDIGGDMSPFPYILILPQDQHERILTRRLEATGITVERPVELHALQQNAQSVTLTMKHADGGTESCETAYLCGCDGAHSTLRNLLALDFGGSTYSQLFYVADALAKGEAMNGELHICLDGKNFALVFPLDGWERVRLIGTTLPEPGAKPLQFEDVRSEIHRLTKLEVFKVNWFSSYHVHHRVAQAFQKGRAFLLGDAAHIHSPAGGQGMNTGIGDAINLGWKLADVVKGRASTNLLESYQQERMAFAKQLVETTDRAFSFVVDRSFWPSFMRLNAAPFVFQFATRNERVRRPMFSTVSQISISYRDSPVSKGVAVDISAGDRLPWVAGNGGNGNFEPLKSFRWQAHVYGNARASLLTLCLDRGIPVHGFAWTEACEAAGLVRNALYYLRPDGHIAYTNISQDTEQFAAYLRRFKPPVNAS